MALDCSRAQRVPRQLCTALLNQLITGDEVGEGTQRLRTTALIWDLGTRLECRDRAFVRTRTEKHCGNKSIVAQLDSNLLPLGQ